MCIIAFWLLFSSIRPLLYSCSLWSCRDLLTNHVGFFFPNFLHFSTVRMYLGLSASFKTFLSFGYHDTVLSMISGPLLWVGHASGHSLVLSAAQQSCPHNLGVLSAAHTLMGRGEGCGRGSCALVEVRLGDLTDHMHTVERSRGRAGQRQTWFVQVDSGCPCSRSPLTRISFFHHRMQEVESVQSSTRW